LRLITTSSNNSSWICTVYSSLWLALILSPPSLQQCPLIMASNGRCSHNSEFPNCSYALTTASLYTPTHQSTINNNCCCSLLTTLNSCKLFAYNISLRPCRTHFSHQCFYCCITQQSLGLHREQQLCCMHDCCSNYLASATKMLISCSVFISLSLYQLNFTIITWDSGSHAVILVIFCELDLFCMLYDYKIICKLSPSSVSNLHCFFVFWP
jgi:hypothetical protein